MSKGSQGQTVSTQVDPATQSYVNQMRQLALGYAGIGTPGGTGASTPAWANAPNPYGSSLIGDVYSRAQQDAGRGAPLAGIAPPPLPSGIQQAIGQYGQYANVGQQGLAALSGQAGAQAQFMNPYLSQMNPFFAQQRQQAVEGANQQATLAGAFGGDRSQIGAAVAGNQADQTQAGFNYQGFLEAMQRAQNAAQMGFGAIGAGAFLPQLYQQGQLNLLGSAIGPYGQTQSQQMHSDPLSQLLGLGATVGGFALGVPPGAAAGSAVAGNWNPEWGKA